MLESDEIKALPKRVSALEERTKAFFADYNKALDKIDALQKETTKQIEDLDKRTKDFFGDFNKALDKIEPAQKDTGKLADQLNGRVKTLEAQVAKLTKK